MWYHIQAERISFCCKVKANAKNNEVVGLVKDGLAINVKAQPIAGKANRVVLKLLAEFFHLKSSEIQLLRGHRSQLKQVAIPNYPHLLVRFAAF